MKRAVLGVIGLALLVGVGFLFTRKPVDRPGPAPAVELPAQPSAELLERAQRDLPRAIAHLENLQPEKAVEILEPHLQAIPNNQTLLQNLSIARALMAMNPKQGVDKQGLMATAHQQLDALSAAYPQNWQAHALHGLLYDHAEDRAAAYREYASIAPVSGPGPGGEHSTGRVTGHSEVAILYAQARSGLGLPNGPERDAAKQALLQAVARQPDDLLLLLALIDEQVTHQDAEAARSLDQLLALAPLVAEPIKRAQRFDIIQSLNTLKAAIAKGEWKTAPRFWSPVRNLVNPSDACQMDRKRLDRHPLDYIADRIEGLPPQTPEPDSPAITLEWKSLTLPEPYSDSALIRQAHWADLTLDRVPELCVLEQTRLAVWSRTPDKNWKLSAECPVSGSQRMILADLDDDGIELPLAATPGVQGEPAKRADLDFVLFGTQGVQLIRTNINAGEMQLEPFPPESAAALGTEVRECTTADFDGDGDLDLLCHGPQGWKLGFNNGRPLFEVRGDTPVMLPENLDVSQLKSVDFDRDHDVDVLVVAGGQVSLLTNLRHGTLRWSKIPGLDAGDEIAEINVLDNDRNGSWDLLLSGPTGQRLVLSRTIEEGDWQVTEVRPLEGGAAAFTTLADLDNDGREDLIRHSESMSISRGASTGFIPAPAVWKCPTDLLSWQAQAIDADADGDLDLCVNQLHGFSLWENLGGNANGWISVEVVAAQVKDSLPIQNGRVNHYGICSLLEAKTSAGYQARVVNHQPTHFGLGPQGQADIVRIVWQNGSPVNTINPPQNATVWQIQTLTGSCPYLYTWDGEKYAFATDLLWSAPLGMPSPAGGLTPARDWEYLKIEGSLLKPRDGLYALQLTEELYEAAYFDQVQLIAVDHPRDVSIFSNEKVGPPMIAEKKIHTVRNPRRPLSARDQRGRDLLPALSHRDEIYTQHWDRKFKQGWTEKTEMELDLGNVPESVPVTLFLTGWIYPTDPAISVSIQQAPELAGFGIQPPSLEVPDGQGGWKTAIPFTGFPGGKTKTIAIDLTGQLTPGDGRVRLVTSMELCWDEAFFTVNEDVVEVRETPLELVSADLHFRGCSARVVHPQFGPERYDYSRVDPMIYSSMEGNFTRYGDVLELLTARDDRMAVLGCGDECTLKFRVPPPPPEGWTRDFLIYNVGWDKDCNPQNIYGKTVEPLPFQAMQSYPPADVFPDDDPHQDYLKTFQTRTQNDIPFRRNLFLESSTQ